jgi:stage V sporulation protein SpoVS
MSLEYKVNAEKAIALAEKYIKPSKIDLAVAAM